MDFGGDVAVEHAGIEMRDDADSALPASRFCQTISVPIANGANQTDTRYHDAAIQSGNLPGGVPTAEGYFLAWACLSM